MKIRTYNDLNVSTVRATADPSNLLKSLLDVTMKKEVNRWPKKASEGTIKFLLDAKHLSPFEHMTITFCIENMSRSLQMQLVRHRNGSFMMSSQHYQDHRDYPVILDPFIIANHVTKQRAIMALNAAIKAYIKLIDIDGVKPEEARQLLPNATGSQGYWTVSARSLMNFFQQRLCKRNVQEMRLLAQHIHSEALFWWPQLFQYIHTDCAMTGKCSQGHMTCGRPYETL